MRNLEATAMMMLRAGSWAHDIAVRMFKKGCYHLCDPINNAEAGIVKVLEKKRGE